MLDWKRKTPVEVCESFTEIHNTYTGASMHHKNIKRIVIKQLKKDHPNWRTISKKEKKQLAKEVTEAVIHDYDFSTVLDVPVGELLGISDQSRYDDILGLDETGRMVTAREHCDFANHTTR